MPLSNQFEGFILIIKHENPVQRYSSQISTDLEHSDDDCQLIKCHNEKHSMTDKSIEFRMTAQFLRLAHLMS